jgi:hypothetical protein
MRMSKWIKLNDTFIFRLLAERRNKLANTSESSKHTISHFKKLLFFLDKQGWKYSLEDNIFLRIKTYIFYM